MLQNGLSGDRRPKTRAAIHEIAPTAALVRVYPERRSVTHIFESDFYRMFIDRRTEKQVAYVIRRDFGKVADWRLAHDFYVPTGTLFLTPEPREIGYVPEDDRSFGLSPARRIATDGGERS